MNLQCEILGSGTSVGVPMPGCSCYGCTSEDERDKRFRSSAVLRYNNKTVMIDMSTDFRMQALRANLQKVDAVLVTHNHADHISGLDDIRPFCFHRKEPIPVYANLETSEWIKKRFDYIWNPIQKGGGLPNIELCPQASSFDLFGETVTPIPVMHGKISIFGYRIDNFAYISDVSEISKESFALLDGVEYLVLDGLRHEFHPTHFSISQAEEAARRIGAKKTWLTHISHSVRYVDLQKDLPDNIEPAYDGLVIDM